MKKLADNFEEYLLIAILPLMCLAVFANTVGRYTQTFSLQWAEEFARYLMIWLVFLGISAAAKKNAHFAVGVVFLLVPARLHLVCRLFILVMTLVCGLSLTVLGAVYSYRLQGMGQTSPALSAPMWFMYGAIPLGCFLLSVRSLQFFLRRLKAGPAPARRG